MQSDWRTNGFIDLVFTKYSLAMSTTFCRDAVLMDEDCCDKILCTPSSWSLIRDTASLNFLPGCRASSPSRFAVKHLPYKILSFFGSEKAFYFKMSFTCPKISGPVPFCSTNSRNASKFLIDWVATKYLLLYLLTSTKLGLYWGSTFICL